MSRFFLAALLGACLLTACKKEPPLQPGPEPKCAFTFTSYGPGMALTDYRFLITDNPAQTAVYEPATGKLRLSISGRTYDGKYEVWIYGFVKASGPGSVSFHYDTIHISIKGIAESTSSTNVKFWSRAGNSLTINTFSDPGGIIEGVFSGVFVSPQGDAHITDGKFTVTREADFVAPETGSNIAFAFAGSSNNYRFVMDPVYDQNLAAYEPSTGYLAPMGKGVTKDGRFLIELNGQWKANSPGTIPFSEENEMEISINDGNGTTTYYTSKPNSGTVTITKFGAVGELIEGTFQGMFTWQNGVVEVKDGRFSLERQEDL